MEQPTIDDFQWTFIDGRPGPSYVCMTGKVGGAEYGVQVPVSGNFNALRDNTEVGDYLRGRFWEWYSQ